MKKSHPPDRVFGEIPPRNIILLQGWEPDRVCYLLLVIMWWCPLEQKNSKVSGNPSSDILKYISQVSDCTSTILNYLIGFSRVFAFSDSPTLWRQVLDF